MERPMKISPVLAGVLLITASVANGYTYGSPRRFGFRRPCCGMSQVPSYSVRPWQELDSFFNWPVSFVESGGWPISVFNDDVWWNTDGRQHQQDISQNRHCDPEHLRLQRLYQESLEKSRQAELEAEEILERLQKHRAGLDQRQSETEDDYRVDRDILSDKHDSPPNGDESLSCAKKSTCRQSSTQSHQAPSNEYHHGNHGPHSSEHSNHKTSREAPSLNRQSSPPNRRSEQLNDDSSYANNHAPRSTRQVPRSSHQTHKPSRQAPPVNPHNQRSNQQAKHTSKQPTHTQTDTFEENHHFDESRPSKSARGHRNEEYSCPKGNCKHNENVHQNPQKQRYHSNPEQSKESVKFSNEPVEIMSVPTRGFSPRELQISHQGDHIRVHASRTCSSKDNCVSREMEKLYKLPFPIKKGSMRSSLDDSGNIVLKGLPAEVSHETVVPYMDIVDDSMSSDDLIDNIDPNNEDVYEWEDNDNELTEDIFVDNDY